MYTTTLNSKNKDFLFNLSAIKNTKLFYMHQETFNFRKTFNEMFMFLTFVIVYGRK